MALMEGQLTPAVLYGPAQCRRSLPSTCSALSGHEGVDGGHGGPPPACTRPISDRAPAAALKSADRSGTGYVGEGEVWQGQRGVVSVDE